MHAWPPLAGRPHKRGSRLFLNWVFTSRERPKIASAPVGMRTADLLPLVQTGQDLFPLMGLAGGRYCAMGGGAPLSRGSERVAGVGVSGGTVEQDVAILEAGLQDA